MTIHSRGKTSDGLDDAALVARAQRDPAAFALLYDRYVEPVYRFCLRRLGDRELAEDATSTIFTKALAGLPRYREQSFRSWLFTIAYHVVTDQFRAPRSDTLDEVVEIPDTHQGPEDEVLALETARELRAALNTLTADQQRVVELRLAGLTGNEIAAALGRSRAAIDAIQYEPSINYGTG